MTDKQYVIRAAQIRGFDVLRPTRAAPGVLVYHWVNGKGTCVADAKDWREAKEQVNAYAMKNL